MIESVFHFKVTVKDGVVPTPDELARLAEHELERTYWEVKVEPENVASPR